MVLECSGDEERATAADAGGVDVAVRAMQRFPDDDGLQVGR